MADHKCPRCGTSAFQHWALGYMHKCHICNHVWKTTS
jgi:ribosomal protein L37AE/L43A